MIAPLLHNTQGSRAKGLRLWMPFDQTSGNPRELSGEGHTFNANGVTRGVAGRWGRAFDFDGSNDTVSNADGFFPSIFQNSGNFTISFWASAPSAQAADCAFSIGYYFFIFGDEFCALYPYVDGGKGGDNFEIYFNGDTIYSENNGVAADGTLHHFVYTCSGGNTHEVFVDSVSIGTDTASKTIDGSANQCKVGAYGNGEEYFDGVVDNVKMWDRVLEDWEIVMEYKYG